LSGYVDFLISKSPIQVFVDTPVIAVVEAKRDNLQSGYGQCVATMVAAQLKNQQEGKAIEKILSVVTTGSLWQFFVLSNSELILDLVEYSVSEISRILGIFERFVIS
jgi:glycerol dehydrogenase-like iron-containing ADH family enzyme